MNNDFLITDVVRVIFVGKNEYKSKKISFKGECSSNELIYNLSGQSTVYFNNQILPQHEDTVRFLPQGKYFKYDVVKTVRDECIDVFFKTDKPVFDKAQVFEIKNKAVVRALFKKLFAVNNSKNAGYKFESISLLYKIFAEMVKDDYIPEKQFEKIKPAIDYIEKNFAVEPLNCEYLASICHISYSYLKKLFILKYGISPKKYVLQLKMNYACTLLESKEYSVTEVSLNTGFSDTALFCKQFKKTYGITPKQFAENHVSEK